MLETTKDRISARVPKPVRETLEEAAALSGATLNQCRRPSRRRMRYWNGIGSSA